MVDRDEFMERFMLANDRIRAMLNRNFSPRGMMTFGLIIVVIVIIVLIFTNPSPSSSNDKTSPMMLAISKKYPSKMSSTNPSDGQSQFKLRDYYILSSYNSCCDGDYKDGTVSRSALETVIRMGARTLDFEVYSVDNRPVVGASTIDNTYMKETYNSIPLGDVLQDVADKAFSGAYAPNPRDPLLVVLRIKSNHPDVYNKVAKAIDNTLTPYLLGPEHGNENHGQDLGDVPLKELMGKAILVVDVSNPVYRQSHLEEFINIGANSPFLRNERKQSVVYTHDMNQVTEFNKKHMTYCMPDLGPPSNEHVDVLYKYGVQMIGLAFQKDDDGFKYLYSKFQGKSGFVLKPKELRYVPVYAKTPEAQNPAVSYQPRKYQGNGYSITV